MATSGLKISSKGQITIPLKIRQRLGVKPGDKVHFVVEEGKAVLKPATPMKTPSTGGSGFSLRCLTA